MSQIAPLDSNNIDTEHAFIVRIMVHLHVYLFKTSNVLKNSFPINFICKDSLSGYELNNKMLLRFVVVNFA